MESQTSNKKWLLITLIIALLLGGVGFWVNHKQADVYRSESSTANAWDSKLAAKQKKIDNAALAKGHATTNYKDSVSQLNSLQQLTEDTTSLFKILENYKNSGEYRARKDEASKYLAPSLLKSNYFFASDKDEDGNSIIDAEGLESAFVSVKASVNPNDSSEVLIKSTWDSGYSDTPSRRHREIDLYNAHYDSSSRKFTKLDLLCVLNEYDVDQ